MVTQKAAERLLDTTRLRSLSDVTHRSKKEGSKFVDNLTKKLRSVLNKEQRDKLIKREKQSILFRGS